MGERGAEMTWTPDDIEKDFYRQMRSMNRNRRHSRAVQMDRDILELENAYLSEIEGYSPAAMEARKQVREQASREIYQQEAERRNEEESRPIVGVFVQIATVCLNFGGEHRAWKITDRCIFCGRIISICRWHHWNFASGWIRTNQGKGVQAQDAE